jgi:hypothetical protein
MVKKSTKPTARGRSKGQKSTNARKTTKSPTKGGKAEKGPKTELAKIGGVHETFGTIQKKAAMLEALKHSLGIVTPALQMANVGRATHYRWLKEDPGYKAEVLAVNEMCFDFVETKLLENVKSGNVVAQIFYAKTKMKARGFVERQEIEVTEKPSFIVKEESQAAGDVMKMVHKKTGTNDK